MSKKKFEERRGKKRNEEGKSLRKNLLSFFDENPGVSYHFKQLAREIGPKNKAVNKELFALLDGMEASGKIKQLADGSYVSTKKTD